MTALLTRLLRPRVYSTALLGFAVLALVWWGGSRAARGQVDVTIEPAMVKGASGAVVTIFEFSDYQ
jgi:hypothetical protein